MKTKTKVDRPTARSTVVSAGRERGPQYNFSVVWWNGITFLGVFFLSRESTKRRSLYAGRCADATNSSSDISARNKGNLNGIDYVAELAD